MGYPSVVWQQQTEKALIITYNNTHLFQKPIPVWDPDYTTTFTTRFRPIPLVDDYNPTYIDPDCGRDPYWVTELYNQDLLQFQYVIDDNDHYNDTVHSRDKRMKSDVSNANEGSDATGNENSDWPDSAVYHKNPEKSLPDLSERQKNDANFSERNSANDSDAQKSPKRGDDIIVPEISQNDEGNENRSPRGGRYNLRPNPNPNYSEDFRY